MSPVLPPTYRALSPIGFFISWAFIPFNVVLAYYLYAQKSGIPLVLFPLKIWAFLFMVVAVYLLIGLMRNNLKHIRWAMILGVIFKTYWAWALLIYAIRDGFVHDLYLLDLWFLVAFVQALVAIYIPPRIDHGLLEK